MTTTAYPEYTQTKEFDSGVTVLASSKPADSVRMSVDSEGAAHIMSLLTDLYSDPNMAVLREYVSNAIDAHNEVGQTDPILVSLPNYLDPRFIVQDFGVGMSAETVRDIYSSYGKSTKRKNFGQIGAFGLGCKSALTLTQQFSLVTIKDGKKTVASIGRGDDGVGTVNIISQSETAEGNGTTIKIPIKDWREFIYRATNFFIAMPAGTALVDGKEPKNRDSLGFLALKQNGAYYRAVKDRTDSSRGLFISMGGIAYPVDKFKLDRKMWNKSRFDLHNDEYQFLAEIPIASVDLTPSREALRYTDRTVKFLSALFQTCFENVITDMIAEVDKIPSRADALSKIREYVRAFYSLKKEEFTWKGKPIQFFIKDASHTAIDFLPRSAKNLDGDYSTSVASPFGVAVPDERVTYIVEATSGDTSRLRSNFKGYVIQTEGKAVPASLLIFEKGKIPKSEWLKKNTYVTYTTADAVYNGGKEYRKANRVPRVRTASTGPKEEMTYEAFVSKGGTTSWVQIKISEAKKTEKYVIADSYDSLGYYAGKKDTGSSGTMRMLARVIDMIAKKNQDVTLLLVPRARKTEALLARFEKAGVKPVMFKDWAPAVFMAYLKTTGFTRADYEVITKGVSYDDRQNEANIEKYQRVLKNYADQVDDPQAKFFLTTPLVITNASNHYNDPEALQSLMSAARTLGIWSKADDYFKGLPKQSAVTVPKVNTYMQKHYPILYSMVDNNRYYSVQSNEKEHLVLYMNAAYAARKKDK